MANKELTAKVKFDVSDAEAKLKRLSNLMKNIDQAVSGKTNKSGLEKNIEKALLQQEKLKQATLKTQLAESKLTAQKHKSAAAAQKVSEATAKTQIAEQRLALQTERTRAGIERIKNIKDQVATKSTTIASKVRQWAANQQMVTSATRSTNSVLGAIGSKLKMIAATYLGIMGMKAAISTSDTITKAQNKLNNLNGGDIALTQQQMDKMYASANKVRMSYKDMLSNASKSMTLAGDAFQGNMDNAIRFQEIMAEAYALGGASAEEMSTSMYQMIQALGAGTLAGDELRSVREGAPLAYKAIEEFAQGVYNTTDSLKEMASQGLITSEMVTAAIMSSGDKMDKQFQNTAMTFEQAWDRIKSAAVKAFEPVSNALNEMLNQAAKNGAFEKIERAFWNFSKVIQIVFKLIKNAIIWVADNWDWLKRIVIGALILMGSYYLVTASIAIASAIKTAIAWTIVHWKMLLIVVAIAAIVYALYLWQSGAIDTCDLILVIIGILVAAFIVLAIASIGWVGLLIAAILLVLGVVFYFFEEVCYGAGWLGAWIVNIVFAIVNFIIAVVYLLLTLIWNIVAAIVNFICAAVMAIYTVIQWIVAAIVKVISAAVMFIYTIIQWVVAFIVNLVMGVGQVIAAVAYNAYAGIVNVAMGIWNVICAVCQNIGIAFQNAWNGALSAFWNFIADCVEGLDWLAKPLEKIAELFGKSFDAGSFAGDIRSKASQYKQKDYVSISDAWSSGMNTMEYKDVGDAWSSGWNTMQFDSMADNVSAGWNVMQFDSMSDNVSAGWTVMDWASFGDAWNSGMGTLDYVDANKWGSTAGNWGAGVKESINEWGSQFQGGSSGSEGSILDRIGNSLGLDFGDMTGTGGFPNAGDLAYDTSGAYNAPTADDLINGALGKDVGNISDNTDSMADSLDLTEEDLEYLRKLADMEWKKEYTTANITVDMSNYNTINNTDDLDGIVTKLGDKLREELNVVANGVYV